jgi:hypothetical protein
MFSTYQEFVAWEAEWKAGMQRLEVSIEKLNADLERINESLDALSGSSERSDND